LPRGNQAAAGRFGGEFFKWLRRLSGVNPLSFSGVCRQNAASEMPAAREENREFAPRVSRPDLNQTGKIIAEKTVSPCAGQKRFQN
jgi:hypothetical protein